jgi:hypothetical protein
VVFLSERRESSVPKRGRLSLWGRVIVAVSCATVTGTVTTAAAAAPSRTLRLISPGGSGGDMLFKGALADGSRVFLATVEQLTVEDNDAALDVYARDADGTVRLISGGSANRDAVLVGASADGRRVFFDTDEALTAEDTDALSDIYARDADAGVRLISGAGSTGARAFFAGASVDGGRVFFEMSAPLVAEDVDGASDVYAHEADGIVRLLSGGTANLGASFVGASVDGSRVFFETQERLADEDGDLDTDVYERGPDGIRLLSAAAANAGSAGRSASFLAASADGGRVFFDSQDPFTAEDRDTTRDIYERDADGTLRLISAGTGNTDEVFAGASVDGSRVFFDSQDPLTAEDRDTGRDIYERDADGTLRLISVGTTDAPAFFNGVSVGGSRVFFSTAEALTADDVDAFRDVYERDADGTVQLVSGGTVDTKAKFSGASADGSRVFFQTEDPLTAAPDESAFGVYERTPDGAVRLLAGGPAGHVYFDGASADGSRVFVSTVEAIAGTGDADAAFDVFESALAVPSFSSGASVTGRPRVGSRLTCTPGGVVGENAGSSLAWLRDGTPIPGATATTYVIAKGDGGHRVACRVTAANPIGSATQTSPPMLVDARAPLVRIVPPRCQGRASRAACRRFQRTVRAWRTLRGTVDDPEPASGLADVQVTIVRKVGRRCQTYAGRRFVTTRCNGAGRFVRPRVSHTGWTLSLRGLKPGRYDIRVRATDNNENAAIAKRTLRLRSVRASPGRM